MTTYYKDVNKHFSMFYAVSVGNTSVIEERRKIKENAYEIEGYFINVVPTDKTWVEHAAKSFEPMTEEEWTKVKKQVNSFVKQM